MRKLYIVNLIKSRKTFIFHHAMFFFSAQVASQLVVPLSESLRLGQSVAAELTGIVAERMTVTGKRVEKQK